MFSCSPSFSSSAFADMLVWTGLVWSGPLSFSGKFGNYEGLSDFNRAGGRLTAPSPSPKYNIEN